MSAPRGDRRARPRAPQPRRRQPPRPRTIAGIFDAALHDDPEREALVTRHARWTYRELERLAERAAAALAWLGLSPGERIAVTLPNDSDIVVAFHGAMRLGAVWVGVNRALAAPEKSFILSDSGASLLLCDADTAAQVAPLTHELPTLRRIVAVEPGDRSGDWPAALASAPMVPLPAVDPLALAAIAYTSGTTGLPKGAMHSQHNLLLPGAALSASRGYGAGLRKGDCLPLTILNLIVLSTLLVAQAGGTVVLMDRIDAAGVAEWIHAQRVTTWNGPPALIHTLAHDASIRPEQLASLDDVWTGGGDCPEVLRRAFEEKFGQPVVASYGLTEAPTIVTMDGRGAAGHRAAASGRPLPHLSVRILGADGNELPAGGTGEICVTGTPGGGWRPMLGYWRREEATAEVNAGGVLHTGDVGYLDDDGYLYVRDRKKLVIIRGGANVYPAEVERVLQSAPGVIACAVGGIPDERLGERVAAAVQAEPGAAIDADSLSAWCRERLARYKVPERFAFVETFERNSMGKIDRRALGEILRDLV